MTMIVHRVFTPGLAQVAYLVADEDASAVAVIDPRRDVDAYLHWAAARGLTITAILETHVHADFVSGARELAAITGAPFYASRLGHQEFPHRALDDGDCVAVGRLTLQAFWTPGHTPEHMSYLLVDPVLGNRPLALFSGDLLFAGEVGRPDLLGAAHTRALAAQLYDTLDHRLAALHDDVVVYPGHTAGSSCGRKIGDAPQTTIGRERRFNYALQPAALASREAFIETILAGMPTPPTYYPTMKRVNRDGPALLRDLPAGIPLSPEQVESRVRAGALIVDARSAEAFARSHIPGSFFGGDDPDFVNWVGWLSPYDRDLILVLDDGRYPAALTELRRIGLDAVAGYLEGSVTAWAASGRPVVSTPTISVETLRTRLAQPDGLVLLDVRSADEWTGGHVAGAVHRFAGEIARGADIPVAGADEIAVTCASGYRSTVAISLLEARGRRNLINVAGGMDAWRAAHLPLEAA
jgi:hydroxyacylglutathione hydrolase